MGAPLLERLLSPYCHQLPERSLHVGASLPLCARCEGLYLGMALVGLWLLWRRFRGRRPWAPRGWLWAALAALLLCAVDGLFGLSHSLGLGNATRLLLGFGAGMALLALVGAAALRWLPHRWFPEWRGRFFVDRPPLGLALAALVTLFWLLVLSEVVLASTIIGWTVLGVIVTMQIGGFLAGVLLAVKMMKRSAVWPARAWLKLGGGALLLAVATLPGCSKDFGGELDSAVEDATALTNKLSVPEWPYEVAEIAPRLRVIVSQKAIHLDTSQLLADWYKKDPDRVQDEDLSYSRSVVPAPPLLVAGKGVEPDPRAFGSSSGACEIIVLADELKDWRTIERKWGQRHGQGSSPRSIVVVADKSVPWEQLGQILVSAAKSDRHAQLAVDKGGQRPVGELKGRSESLDERRKALGGKVARLYGSSSASVTITKEGIWVAAPSGGMYPPGNCARPGRRSRYGARRYGPEPPTLPAVDGAIDWAGLNMCVEQVSQSAQRRPPARFGSSRLRDRNKRKLELRFDDGLMVSDVAKAMAANYNKDGIPHFELVEVMVPRCSYSQKSAQRKRKRDKGRTRKRVKLGRINPFLHEVAFPAWVGVCVLLGFVVVARRRKAWKREVERVRATVLGKLGLADDESSDDEASERILALVPAKAVYLEGKLESLGEGSRVWLCFLDDGLIAVHADDGEMVALSKKQLRRLYLGSEKGDGAVGIELKGGKSTFAVERLDDLVRIVNILIKRGITLRYLKS